MSNKIISKTSEGQEVKQANRLTLNRSMGKELTDNSKGFFCSACGSEITFENILQEQNRKFILTKYNDGKLDDAITFARIINEWLPEVSMSSETKDLAMTVAETIGNKLETTLNTITTVSNMLSQLLEKVPEGIKAELVNVINKVETLNESTSKLNETTSKSSESLLQTFNELTNKPTSKGKAGERTLSQAWSMTYTEDIIDEKGGPGETDFLVTPSVKNKYTGKFTVERKTGSQKYNFKHVKEAIKHARDEGAQYALVVYDSFENNMPDVFGPLYIDKLDGITVAVTDVANNGWKMARYIFSVLELNINSNGDKVDVTKIAETVKEMYKITEQIDYLRKKNNSAVQACEAVRDTINTLEQIFEKHIQYLRSELGELQ